jgi:hypothetical protein
MPRDGSNIYNLPFPPVTTGTSISSGVYNGFTSDVALDLNTPRPIVAGGTGATSADAALAALSGQKAGQVVTNYDSHVWIAGSFYSATTATGEPVDGRAFSGIVYMSDSNNIVVEARDATDGKLYIRRKTAGVWGSWILDGDLSGVNGDVALKVAKAGDTMTGHLSLPTSPAAANAVRKDYVDAADAALSGAITTGDNLKVAKAGDTMTNFLTLHADPTSALHAATKQYVDLRVRSVKRQVFTASGTYTPSSGMIYCIIECIGNGGGGGSAAGAAPSVYGGGGGGSGGYSRLLATAATIGASQTVTVGSGAAGGASGSNNGANGTDVSVGTLCIGKGGLGGKFGSSAQVGIGGAGGVAGTGDLTAAGMPGGHGIFANGSTLVVMASGTGGSSFLGGGALGVNAAGGAVAAGATASSYGSGGSGAQANAVASNAAGGNGSSGLVSITEFCTVP